MERLVHVEVKSALKAARDREISVSGKPCFPVGDGATVWITGAEVYMPGALACCGRRHPHGLIEPPFAALLERQ